MSLRNTQIGYETWLNAPSLNRVTQIGFEVWLMGQDVPDTLTTAETLTISVTNPSPAIGLVRDPWDVDEWGRFYPGAGYHQIT